MYLGFIRTGAQIDLPMAEFSDPILRVKDCDRQIAQQKESTIPLLLLFLGRTLGHHFTALCGVITANRVNVAGLTNFPVSIFNGIKDSLQFELLDTELAAGALLGVSGMHRFCFTIQTNKMMQKLGQL